jgi:hypothetical protein
MDDGNAALRVPHEDRAVVTHPGIVDRQGEDLNRRPASLADL